MGKRAWGCFNFPSALAVVQVAARLELVKDTVAFLLLDLLASSTMLCSVAVKCSCCRSVSDLCVFVHVCDIAGGDSEEGLGLLLLSFALAAT